MSVAAEAEPSPSKLGRYELITKIASGGMADVHLALQRGTAGFEKLVVLKVVHASLVRDPMYVDLFRAEAKLSALIKHPNVVDTYELGEDAGRHFIAMEYLEGEPLLALLEKGHGGTRLDPLSTARIIAETCEGLEAAHSLKGRDGKPLGVVHHDISLGNIFVLYSGQVKLLDFGVARATQSAAKRERAMSEPGAAKVFGKLAYMAPEKLDERPGDRRSDIWSLGCVMWEALTLKRLFKGANDTELLREVRYVKIPPPSQVTPEVPAELDAIVLKALDRDPTKRFKTAKDFGAAIEEVLTAKAYGAKNYRIEAYMRATFAERVAARDRLLREVSGDEPTRPSAQIIDAAFGDTQTKRESSLPSIDHILNPATTVTLPEGSTGADPIAPSKPATGTVEGVNPFDVDEVAQTVFDDIPANAEASRSVRYQADPSWIRSPRGESLRELQRKVQQEREDPGRRRRQLVPIAAGAVGLLALVVIIATQCGGDESKQAASPPAAPSTSTSTSTTAIPTPAPAPSADPTPPPDHAVAAVVPDEPAAPAEPTDPTEPAEPAEIEMLPEPEPAPEPAPAITEPAKPAKKKRPKPAGSAQELYNKGLEQLRRNELKAALASFTDARRANGSFAPAWYGLGLVHEKLKNRGAAKAAYQRYLSLAPRAANAQEVRNRINRL